jgi:hypothetical protein
VWQCRTGYQLSGMYANYTDSLLFVIMYDVKASLFLSVPLFVQKQ